MPLVNDANTVILKPTERLGDYSEGRVKTGGSIKPGYLIEQIAAGTFQPHGTAGGAGEWLVAIEDGLINPGTVNDARTAGQLVRYIKVQPGDELMMRVAASATALAVGDKVSSNGDGCVRKETSTGVIFGRVIQAFDNSGNASSEGWVRIRASF